MNSNHPVEEHVHHAGAENCSKMQPYLKQNNTYLYPPPPPPAPLPFFFFFLFFLAVSCDLVDLGTFSFWGDPVRLTGR